MYMVNIVAIWIWI